MKWLQEVVAKSVGLPAPDEQGVCNAAGRAALRPARRGYTDGRAIANPGVLARKQGNESLVLAQRDSRQAADASVGGTGYPKARTRDRGVMWPRVVLKGIEQ
jgi:hypothetical protein